MEKRGAGLRSFLPVVLPLLLPVLIEQYFVSIVNSVNTIMVTRLGSEEIAAIASVGSFLNMIAAFFVSLSIGGTILAAQYMGRRERQRMNQVAALGISISFLLAAAVSLIIFIFRVPIINKLFGAGDPNVLQFSHEYFSIVIFYFIPHAINLMAFGVLRGAGDVRTPMKISIIMNLVHVAANYLLVYGVNLQILGHEVVWQGLGVKGSAASLLVSQYTGLIIVFFVLTKGSRSIHLDFMTDFHFDRRIVSNIFKIGVPSGIEQLILNFGFLLIQTFIITLSTAAIAAHNIVNSVTFLINAPALAIATISSTVIGRRVGEGSYEEAKKELGQLEWLAILSFLASWLIFIPGAKFFVGLYSSDTLATQLALPLVISYLLFTSFTWPGANQLPNGLRAAGDVNFPSIVSIVCISLRVLAAYICLIHLNMGLTALWVICYLDIAARALLHGLRRRGTRWLEHRMID